MRSNDMSSSESRPSGFAGRLYGSLSVSLPGVSLAAIGTAEVSTLATAVSDSIVVGGESVTLDVPAGPFIRLVAEDARLTVAGNKLSGTFTFTKSGSNVQVAVNGLVLEFGDGEGGSVKGRADSGTFSLSPPSLSCAAAFCGSWCSSSQGCSLSGCWWSCWTAA